MEQIRKEKIKQTVQIAVFVSLGALIKLQAVAEGFIVGLSVVVFAIFIYSYVQLSPLYIAIMSGIFSPALRGCLLWYHSGDFQYAFLMSLPDVFFFFTYGVVCSGLKKLSIPYLSSGKKFLYDAGISDFLSNHAELLVRSLILKDFLLCWTNTLILLCIAVSRTVIIWIILVAMEANAALTARREHDEEYKKLTLMASEMCNELYIMQKNIGEIENLMKNAYTLTRELEEMDAPKKLRFRALEIAKDAHEIKGDYVRAINSMRDEFVEKYEQPEISMGDVTSIIKADVSQYIEKNGLAISFYAKVRDDFYIKEHFEMVSIIRNLVFNSIEAITEADPKRGYYIYLQVYKEEERYIISVSDNGPGIPEDIMDSIFLSKFSTKYSSETGNMYRGVGLLIVKDYVEKKFKGSISVTSQEGVRTEFKIVIPKRGDQCEHDEILHN